MEQQVAWAFTLGQSNASLGHKRALAGVDAIGEDAVEAEVDDEMHDAVVGLGDATVRVRPSLAELPVFLAVGARVFDVLRVGLHEDGARGVRAACGVVESEGGHLRVPVGHGEHPLLVLEKLR